MLKMKRENAKRIPNEAKQDATIYARLGIRTSTSVTKVESRGGIPSENRNQASINRPSMARTPLGPRNIFETGVVRANEY